MTDLLSAVRGRVLVPAALTGAASAGLGIAVAVTVALAGWFSADAGRYGDTRDASRVGVDAWLLAQGAGLRVDGTQVTVLPLLLSLTAAVVTFRLARRTALRSALGHGPEELPRLLSAGAVLALTYGLVALLAAVLARHPAAQPGPEPAFLGGCLLAAVAGTAGLLDGSGQGRAVLAAAPGWLRPVLVGAAATVLLMLTAASCLVAVALLADFGTAATVLSRLHADGPAGLMYTLVGIAFVPNAVLLGASYLLGPGFMVGTGTVVSPAAVVLGPVPAFPLLAALPDGGPPPAWAAALLGVPAAVAAVAMALTTARMPAQRLGSAAVWGLGAGLAAAVVVTVLVGLAGGAAGPGRMADVGAVGGTLLAAVTSFPAGGAVGAVFGTWMSRRSRARESVA